MVSLLAKGLWSEHYCFWNNFDVFINGFIGILGIFIPFQLLKELLSKAGKVVSFTMFMAVLFHMKLLSKV